MTNEIDGPRSEEANDNIHHPTTGYGAIDMPYQRNDAMELNITTLDELWILLENDAL